MSFSKPLLPLPHVPKKLSASATSAASAASATSAVQQPLSGNKRSSPSPDDWDDEELPPLLEEASPPQEDEEDEYEDKRPSTPPPTKRVKEEGTPPPSPQFSISNWTPDGSPEKVMSARSSPARKMDIGRVLQLSNSSSKTPASPMGEAGYTPPSLKRCPSGGSAVSPPPGRNITALLLAPLKIDGGVVSRLLPPTGPPSKRRPGFDGVPTRAQQVAAAIEDEDEGGEGFPHPPERTLSGCVGNCRYTCTGKCKGSF